MCIELVKHPTKSHVIISKSIKIFKKLLSYIFSIKCLEVENPNFIYSSNHAFMQKKNKKRVTMSIF